MLYIDPNRNFNIFSYGKTGTNFLTSVISFHLKSMGLEFDINYHMSPVLVENKYLPIYRVTPMEYAFYKKVLYKEKGYVIIRNPRDRLISGIIQNICNMFDNKAITNLLDEQLIRDKFLQFIASRYHYHTGNFLTELHDRNVLTNSVIVDISELTMLAHDLFNYRDEQLDHYQFNSVNDKTITVLTEDFREQIRRMFSIVSPTTDSFLLKLFFSKNLEDLLNFTPEFYPFEREKEIYNIYKERAKQFKI